jgi:tetratricopeptide (TPR) repeat protein
VEDQSKSDDSSRPRSGLLGSLDQWQRYLVAVVALLTVVAQLWGIIENRWQLVVVTLVALVVLGSIYAISQQYIVKHPVSARAIRIATIGLLIGVQLCALVVLFFYSYYPRLDEQGKTRIAVAVFDGPPLPAPYKECRPSDMLVHTLEHVSARFGGLTAFELPYSVNPDNRLARTWARFHGWFDAADVIVYGEYILDSSGHGANGSADEIVINPEVITVPLIPIGYTSAPLYGWSFAGSVARIADLCGSDLPEAGPPPAFLDNARRSAVALIGIKALAAGDLQTATDAQIEAQRVGVSRPQRCEGDPNGHDASSCPGYLAFYLATLDARLGALQRAAREYQYAAGKLGAPEAYLDLGELYIRLSNPSAAFHAFDAAVNADPNSVAALATRAEYERDYLRPRESAIDLQQAIDLQASVDENRAKRPQGDIYNQLALSRALLGLQGPHGVECGLQRMRRILYAGGFHSDASNLFGAEPFVEYGIYLGKKSQPEAEAAFDTALKERPDSTHANYRMGLLREGPSSTDKAAAAYYLRRAEHSPALTDEDFLYRANAAYELAASNFDSQAWEKVRDLEQAKEDYAESIRRNPGAAYAYYGRALMEKSSDPGKALSDLEISARLHPNDQLIQSALAQFLDSLGRRTEATRYHEKAATITRIRIPTDEQQLTQTCTYVAVSPSETATTLP